MNKILIGKDIISDSDRVIISNNKITFKESGEYVIEYVQDLKKKIVFDIYDSVRIIETSFDHKLDLDNKYIINNGSTLIIKFYNNEMVNEIIDIDLCNSDSKIDYQFANICRGIENYTININHKCMKTMSNIDNRSVALKNSKINFVINSRVLKKSYDSVLNQNTRIVTMDDCDAKIEPNMFIDIDQVEAKHGSIIGSFKEDDVFYLMSKGISYNDALKLLIKGYLLKNIGGYFDLRQRIMEIINTYWR